MFVVGAEDGNRDAILPFAGMRTLTMLGVVGGLGGLLLSAGHAAAGAAVIAGGMAIVVAAYVMTVRRPGIDPEATTEVAATVVIALGALAGVGNVTLAAAAGALVVLALHEKERLHHAITHVREDELRAAARFSVLAFVILPLLPEGPILGALAIRPRALWIVVLLFCAINFAAFVARRAAGPGRGYGIVGMLGGLISSTAVTLDFSRRSRAEPALSRSLASGVAGACTVLIPRVLAVSAVLNARVALALLPLLAGPLVVGGLFVLRDWRRPRETSDSLAQAPPGNPLRLVMAIRMTLLFQFAMIAIHFARELWTTPGLFATAAALGATDVDALTVGMSRPAEPIAPAIAARAITIGILSNTVLKLVMAQVLGTRAFRSSVLLALGALGAALVLSLVLV